MPKNVALVAGDYLESKIVASLAVLLQQAGCITTTSTQMMASEAVEWVKVKNQDVVISTMSQNSTAETAIAGSAKRYGKPLVMLALSYGAWRSEAFEKVREHCSLLFVADEYEAQKARSFFPTARICAVGNPEWENFSTPTFSREEVRNKLFVGEGEKLVIISGDKSLRINLPLIAVIHEALCQLPRQRWQVAFTVHPGHEGGDFVSLYRHELSELGETVPHIHYSVSCKTQPFGIGTPDMVAGADVVVGTNSTVLIQAAHLRIPAVSILLRPALYPQTLPREHEGWWRPVDSGSIAGVYDLSASTTAYTIGELLNPDSVEHVRMRKAQGQDFPPRIPGTAYKKIIDQICAI